MNGEKIVRPFSLEYEEAKRKIIQAINEATQIHGVPFYLLEEVLNVIAYQVQDSARKERENAQKAYQKRLAEQEEAEV